MLKAVDLSIVVDASGKIVSYVLADETHLKAFKALLKNWVGEPIEACLSIDLSQSSGLVAMTKMHLLYQVLPLEVGGAQYRQVLFSHSAMNSVIYSRAMDVMEEGVHIYNKQGYALYLNKASERLSGIEKSNFEGQHLLDLYELDENFSTTLTTLRTKKPVLNRCDVFRTCDQKTLTTINSAYPLIMDGELIGAILLENDVKMLEKKAYINRYLNAYMTRSGKERRQSKYFRFDDIVFESEKMADLIHISKKLSLNEAPIFIYGETGTGKELLAQSIHQFGKSEEAPFVSVNCAAIPQTLAESLFFGTVKGAFTGSEHTEGFFAQANGGTLFLDEVNSMPLDMQSKLLRVLQEKKYRKVGSKREVPADVRIIAASNAPLEELVSNKAMRPDFYYRISTIVLSVPPLRGRQEDVEALTAHFIARHNEATKRQVAGVTQAVAQLFRHYPWPGNIRELSNAIEYAFAMTSEETRWLNPSDLPEYLVQGKTTYALKNSKAEALGLSALMACHEKALIDKYLKLNAGNVSQTAKILQIKRQSLQYRMRKYNLSAEGCQK